MKATFFLSILLTVSALSANAGTGSFNRPSFCLACAVPDGLSAGNVTDSTALLSWNAVGGASQYTIEVQDEQNIPSVFHLETNVNGTSYQLSGLQAGVLYKFKVRARCGGDKSDWSDWTFFKAASGQGGGGSNTCTAPSLLSVSVSGANTTLSWNQVAGATAYYLEVEDEQNNAGNFHIETTVQDSFYVLTGLQSGVLYKFKVSTHCGGGQSNWSNWLFFNGNGSVGNGGNGNGGGTGSCATPTGTQVSNITANGATLAWDAVPGVLSYTLEIERNQPGLAAWQVTQLTTNANYNLTGLNPSTRYKFKVRANCPDGSHSDWSSWRKFKTLVMFTNDQSDDRDHAVNPLDATIWPNPAQTEIHFHLDNLKFAPTWVRLFDLTGHVVREQQFLSEAESLDGDISLNDLPNGLYLMQAINGENARVFKIMVNQY